MPFITTVKPERKRKSKILLGANLIDCQASAETQAQIPNGSLCLYGRTRIHIRKGPLSNKAKRIPLCRKVWIVPWDDKIIVSPMSPTTPPKRENNHQDAAKHLTEVSHDTPSGTNTTKKKESSQSAKSKGMPPTSQPWSRAARTQGVDSGLNQLEGCTGGTTKSAHPDKKADRKKIDCIHWAKGKCTRDKCRFLHDPTKAPAKSEQTPKSDTVSDSEEEVAESADGGDISDGDPEPCDERVGAPEPIYDSLGDVIDVLDVAEVELRTQPAPSTSRWGNTIFSFSALSAGGLATLLKFVSDKETRWIKWCQRLPLVGFTPSPWATKVFRYFYALPGPMRNPLLIGVSAGAAARIAYFFYQSLYVEGDTAEVHKQMVGFRNYKWSWLGKLTGIGRQNQNQLRDFQERRGLTHHAHVTVHNGLVKFLKKKYRGSNIEAHLPRSWYRTIVEYSNVIDLAIVDNSVRYTHQLLHSAHAQDVACGLVAVKPLPVGRPN